MTEGKSGTKKILMFAGAGCLALIGLCCLSGGALYFMKQSDYEGGGVEHAELYLDHLEQRRWSDAFEAWAYMGNTSIYQLGTFEECMQATVLGDITSHECEGASGSFASGDGVDVECTVTSAAHGRSEVTIHVNSPDEVPYLGFVWFPASAWTGPAWHGDPCATWSGREYFSDPPEGRVRP